MTAAPDLSGYWDADTRVIHVANGASRFALEHERGHAFDDLMLDDGERNRSQHLYYRSLDLYWLYWDALDNPTSSPSELFADAYASARLRRTAAAGHLWQTGYGYYPLARQHRRITAFIRSAARTPGVPTTQVAAANGY
jgi:hypothetical protein